MKRTVLGIAVAAFMVGPAHAGFDRWTTEIEDDPFSGGAKVTVDYSTSLRSGVLLSCDSAGDGVRVRAVPGYIYEAMMKDFTPLVEFAVDGEVLDGGPGSVLIVGDNLAAVDLALTGSSARNLLRAFAAARKQIAIKDGMSDRPYLLKARGSTKAGEALLACMKKQPSYNLMD